MAPSVEREGSTCPICLDAMDSGSGVVSLAPCGHILHRACFESCVAAAAGFDPLLCPMCRGPVAEERIRSASAVPGAQLSGGTGYAQYAPRSVLPPTPSSPGSASASPATDIPADARDELLEVISAQLDAAGSATAVLPAAAGPGTWCFSIDVSSSMGSSHSWQPGAVSRLCFALASLACVVDAKVAPGDWVTVQAFDAEQATLKPWFRKPALFDRAAFLAEVTGEVRACGLSRYGTATCTAVEEAVLTLAEKVDSLAEPQRSASSGSGAGELGAAHSLVLLTDGMAADEGYAFHWAADLLRDPPFEDGGFKALLLHIADNGRSSRCLANLAADTSGAPLEYVQVLRLQMGASLNLTPLPATVPSHRQDAAADSRRERDWRSVREFGGGVSAFITSPVSSRPSRRPSGGGGTEPGSTPLYTPYPVGHIHTLPHDPDAPVYSPTCPEYIPSGAFANSPSSP